jgi:cell division protease FtsH
MEFLKTRPTLVFLAVALALVPLMLFARISALGDAEGKTLEEQTTAVASGEAYVNREAADGKPAVDIVNSSEFLALLGKDDNAVTFAAVNPDASVAAVLTTPDVGEQVITASRLTEVQLEETVSALSQAGVPVSVTDPGAGPPGAFPTATAPAGSGTSLLFTLFLVLFAVMIASFLFSQFRTRSGGARLGKAAEGEAIPSDRFSDVAGCEEAVEDMREIVLYLKEPERFTRAGATAPRGALLVGPPGTGKTLLARAVAGEANVPFYAASGSDFVEMFVGVGASRVRSLFKKARKHSEGAIVFIDEIDAIGRKRSGASQAVSNQEQESTLNALLVEMDGFHRSNIIVIGATNREDILDPALRRPGRLDRTVSVNLPDRLGREKILATHCQGKPVAKEVDLAMVARRTPGMSGADLAQVVNEACLEAARADRDVVLPVDFDTALATVAMGKARTSAVVSEHDRQITAWHEAGHTVAALVVPDADPPVSVSIIPRGPAGGVTWMAPGDDLFLTRNRAFARLVVAMSGRAAEEFLLDGEFTSGPHGDLQAATDLALAMVTQYGMTDIGLMTKSEGVLSVGGKVMDDSVDAVEHLLLEALNVSRRVLRDHSDLLKDVAEALLENDTLAQADLIAIQASSADGKAKSPIAHTAFSITREEPVISGHATTFRAVERGNYSSREGSGDVLSSLLARLRRWRRARHFG